VNEHLTSSGCFSDLRGIESNDSWVSVSCICLLKDCEPGKRKYLLFNEERGIVWVDEVGVSREFLSILLRKLYTIQ